MSSFHYLNLEKNEKEIFLPKIFDILKLFCRSKDELCVLIDDLQKNVKKLDSFFVEDDESEEEVERVKKKKKVIEVKKREWRFTDLSPNIIVYNVLSFRLIDNDEIEDKFDLYGYFKLDRLRNIWFIFTSVDVHSTTMVPFMPFYINIERLMFFRCNGTFFKNNNLFKDNNESFNFKNLESLYYPIIYSENELSLVTIESIMKNNKFYKLKSIEVLVNVPEFLAENIYAINLNGIENLKISDAKWLLLDPNNLRLLELNYVDLKGYENWDQLINVEKLEINECEIKGGLNSFFKVHKFEKLKELKFYDDFFSMNDDRASLENVRVSWNYLQKIKITRSSIAMDSFFINNEFKNLKTIKLSYLIKITGNKWKLSNVIQSFKVKLCPRFEPSFFKRNEMKNVEKITCIGYLKINREIFKNKIEEFNYKKEYSNFKNLIKNKIQDIVYKKKSDELCNLKCLVLDDDETYEK